MPRHLNSYISVKVYDTSEPLVGLIQDSRKPRITEVAALDRMAFGELIPASNNATYDPDMLRCTVCGEKKHILQFHRDARYTWRQCRRYECSTCEKLQVIDQKARRDKRHAKWKK